MKKAELDAERVSYDLAMEQVGAAMREGRHREGVREAVVALPYVDGMMRHAKKYENVERFGGIEAIEVIFKFAPLLLDEESLAAVGALLKSQRRIDRESSADLAGALERAEEVLNQCYRLWSLMDAGEPVGREEAVQFLGEAAETVNGIATAWEGMGLIERTADRRSVTWRAVTRMAQEVQAMCGFCGVVNRGAKVRFLSAVVCRGCAKTSVFSFV